MLSPLPLPYSRPGYPVPFRAQAPLPTKRAQHASREEPADGDSSVWRDTALRYGGYADEVGEFMTPYLGNLGKIAGYGISTLYCLADIGTTLPRKYAAASPDLTTGQKIRKTAAEGADLSMFHLGATLLVPPQIIGKTVQAADYLLDPRDIKPESWIARKVEPLKRKMTDWGVHRQIQAKLDQAEKSEPIQALTPRVNQVKDHFMGTQQPNRTATAAKANETNRPSWFQKLFSGSGLAKDITATVSNLDDDLDNHRDKMIQAARIKTDDVARLCLLKPWPVLLGIAMVPMVAHPFDKLMLKIQDWTIRPLVGKNKLVRENGKLKSVRNPEFWGKNPRFGGPHSGVKPMTAHFSSGSYRQPVFSYPAARFGYPPNPFQSAFH